MKRSVMAESFGNHSGKMIEVVGTGSLEIAQHAALAVSAVRDDGGRDESHHVHDLPPRKVRDGSDVVQRQPGVRRRVCRHPSAKMHLHGVDVLHGPGIPSRRRRGAAASAATRKRAATRARRSLGHVRVRSSAGDRDDDRQRQEVDGVAALLEGRPAIGGEQRHADRMQHEGRRGPCGRAPRIAPDHPEPEGNEERQERRSPTRASGPTRARTVPAARTASAQRLAGARKESDQTSLDLGRGGGRQRRPGGGEIERDPGRRTQGGHADEDRRPSRGDRPRHPDERHQQQGFRPRKRRETKQHGRRPVPPRPHDSSSAAVTSSAARQTSMPDSAPQTSGPAIAVATPARTASHRSLVHRAASLGDQCGREAGGDASHLRPEELAPISAKPPASTSVQRGAVEPGDRHAGVVGEAVPFREIPREVQMDPRVVERERGEAPGARDLRLAELEEAESERERRRHARARRPGPSARTARSPLGRESPASARERVAGVLHRIRPSGRT